MLPKPADWTAFYANVKRKVNLDLDLYKANQLQRRIVSMAEQKDCKTLDQFWTWISLSPANMEWFLDRLAINVSELFRNPEKWREMEGKILPELLKKTSRLKIWSAGCSYGAEAHTLAAILDQRFSGSHKIIGTDIDTAALNQAKAGTFGPTDIKAVPKEYAQYFHAKGTEYTADPRLKKYLEFRKGNLLADRFDTGFDLIMCRNVVIYFTEEAKADLYKKFFQALKPGGILFVGSTERIFKADEIGYQTVLPFYYQKPLLGEKSWRNAS